MSAARFTLLCALIAAIVFIAVAPTLRWFEFSSGSENLITETVLEMHRGGPWFIPTLDGAPRTNKPPLPAWVCAAFVRPSTVAALSDPAQRTAAYKQLGWEVRWPAMVFSCLALLACGWMGRILVSDGVGVAAAAIMASSILFLRFSRSMTTDVQLMLWVAIANVFFSIAIFKNRRWLGGIFGAIAIGLALMSKGPVAIAQTVAPIVAAWSSGEPGSRVRARSLVIAWAPVLAAVAIALIIALPWPVYAMTHLPNQLHLWISEVAEGGTVDAYSTDPPWAYSTLILLLLPWTALFIVGVIVLYRQKTQQGMFVILLTLAPIVVMSCFKEKNDRYLLPMIVPGAIVCAAGLLMRDNRVDRLREIAAGFTWGFLLVVAIGLPIAGALFPHWLHDIHGNSWWSLATAIPWAVGLGGLVIVAWRLDPTGRYNLIPAGLVVMLLANILLTRGYAKADRGLSDGRPVADAIVAILPPNAPVWAFTEPGRFSRMPVDVTIYLDRVVHPTTNPAALPLDAPQAVLVHCRANQSMPPSLAGWRVIGSTSKNQGIWRVCVPPGM